MSVFFQKIDLRNPPQETVLAALIDTSGVIWNFIEDPVIGQIKIKYGRAWCVLPYLDPDDQGHYQEEVSHFIAISDLHKRVAIIME